LTVEASKALILSSTKSLNPFLITADSQSLYLAIAEKGCPLFADPSAPKNPGTLVLNDKDKRAWVEEA
jgi:hypothetical protein